ncbi:hypothetical protein DPMN_169218 [Dreissena polymorpha]|uniref:Uncharacterized protein n=1 Tax=Dreissena polymorpha TaxID=45954 RepID=A0A9D4F482_DREPO|nr:hypothetical protein DPMN_169218 [Dreissena polymorpha]
MRVIKRYREQRKSDRENETSDAPSNEAPSTDTGSRKRVRVSEDFPERVWKARYSLILFLKESLEAGKNAYLRFDKLIVNGNNNNINTSPAPVSLKRPVLDVLELKFLVATNDHLLKELDVTRERHQHKVNQIKN